MIRPARPDDVPAMLSLIRELAAFEREPDAVVNDETQLAETLFGQSPRVFAHIAEADSEVVGTAIWFLNYSTWTGRAGIYLEDLIVRADRRGGGHGRDLVAELARICVARGYPRLEWSVLNWNSPAWGFYRSLGALPMSEWTVHRLDGSALTDLGLSATVDID